MSTSRPPRSLPTAGSAPTRRFRSPFWASAPSIVLAMAYAAEHGDRLAGLVLVAAACLGIAFAIYQAFSPRDAIAPGAETRQNPVEPSLDR